MTRPRLSAVVGLLAFTLFAGFLAFKVADPALALITAGVVVLAGVDLLRHH